MSSNGYVPDDHGIMIFKFGKKKYMDLLLQGNINFSCAGAFIKQFESTNNTVQGDSFEGVFARLKKNDSRIEEMKQFLKKDLEIIDDKDYVFLRRKSAKFKPIFCFYGYTVKSALEDNKPTKIGKQKFTLEFDNRLYEGFTNYNCNNVLSNENRFSALFFQTKPFVDFIKCGMFDQSIAYKMRLIEYRDFNDVFFIRPDTNYDELFVKSNEYEYQHETRICLTEMNFNVYSQRYNVKLKPFNLCDFWQFDEKIRVEYMTVIQK